MLHSQAPDNVDLYTNVKKFSCHKEHNIDDIHVTSDICVFNSELRGV